MRKFKLASALLFSSFFLLAACGQKGPLFLPANDTFTGQPQPDAAKKPDDKKTESTAQE